MEKYRYWTASLYPESMIDEWQEKLAETIQLPCCWIVHDQDLVREVGENRKLHAHLMVAWPGPTTKKHAEYVFNLLAAPGHESCHSPVKPVLHMANMYDYFIHDTVSAKKAGKYLYRKEDRHTENGFDIGEYVQISKHEENEVYDALVAMILSENISNFADFYVEALEVFADRWEVCRQIVRSYSAVLDRIIKGNFHRLTLAVSKELKDRKTPAVRP